MSSTSSTFDPATLDTVPAASPPPGVLPNLEHPKNNGSILIIVGSVLVVVMIIFVIVRIYTKVKIVKKWTPDDYTCIIAAIGTIFYYIAALCAVTVGHFGRHMWDLSVADVSSDQFLVSGFFTNWMTAIVWPFAKMTFLLLYIQLFWPMKWLRFASYAGVVVNILYYLSILIATLALTVPHPGQSLLQTVQSSRQAKALKMAVPTASINLALDVYILVLPIAGVSKLQLPTRRKLGVMAVFMTGFIACIASSLSIYYKSLLEKNDADVTYMTMPVILTCLAEMCVGVIASCMPSLSNLLHHLPEWHKVRSKLSYHSSTTAFSSSDRSKASVVPSWNAKKQRAKYIDLESSTFTLGERDHEMRPVKTIRTYIHTGDKEEVDEDGIHLQYKVEQESTRNGRKEERPSAV